MWINKQNQLYFGDIAQGDREATPEEIADWELSRLHASHSTKLVGIEFEGVMCSAMKTDQDGLVAVLVASQLQGANFNATQFKFENGSVLIITKDNIAAFIATWMPFRQSFYLP
jgi:hypothetical protein